MQNHNYKKEVPILITVWRRNDKLLRLLDSLREHKPKKIYVSCDGPRTDFPNDYYEVQQVRNTVAKYIDWDSSIYRLFSDKNLGCRKAMSKAISWFFTNEEEGIILEEDCILHTEFIPYCSELLEKYRNNQKIWNICGTNFQKGRKRGLESYYFSKYFHCWGWASWRDRWINYDSDLKNWPKLKKTKLLEDIFIDLNERNYWSDLYDKLYYQKKPNSWAYRWAYTCFINKAYSIIPNQNLVKNIGFDDESTHTNFTIEKSLINKGICPLIHPKIILPNFKADKFTFYNHYKMTLKRRIEIILKMPFYYPKKSFKLIYFYICRILKYLNYYFNKFLN